MIRITNSAGLDLGLLTGQQLITEVAAGWLADEALPPSGYSYPVKFPLSEANRRFLGTDFLPNAGRPQQQLAVTLTYAGMLTRACVLSYRISEGVGDGTLRFNGGEVVPDLKRLTLQDVFSGPVVLPRAASGNTYDLAGRMLAAAQAPIGAQPLTFFPIKNEGFFPRTELERLGKTINYVYRYVNSWDGTKFSTGKGFMAVPCFYLTWVLEKLLAHVGYRLAGSWPADIDNRRRVILNQTSIRGRSLSQAGYLIIPGDHLPNMKCADFLKAIRTQFGLQFDYDSNRKTCTLTRFSDVVGSADIPDLTRYLSGSWGVETGKNEGVRVQAGRNGSDSLYQERLATGNTQPIAPEEVTLPGLTGELPTDPVQLPIATTQLIWEQPGLSGRWLIPAVHQLGNVLDVAYADSERYVDSSGRQKNPMSLVLLTYWGMQPDSLGSLYPFASPGVRNARWEVLGKTGLELAGHYGAWQTQLRSYSHFRDQCRPVTVRLRLPGAVFAGLTLFRPLRLDLDRLGPSRYLIEKVQAEAPGADGVCSCRVTLLTIPPTLSLAPFVSPAAPLWLELVRVVSPAVETVVGDRTKQTVTTTLSLRVWADKARTTPVPVIAGGTLAVQLRVKTWVYQAVDGGKGGELIAYNEHPIGLTSTGDRTVILTPISASNWVETANGDNNEYTSSEYSLDPGEGYNLL